MIICTLTLFSQKGTTKSHTLFSTQHTYMNNSTYYRNLYLSFCNKVYGYCAMIGSTIQKINFYKSIPLPLWDVHCSILLLDPPWNRIATMVKDVLGRLVPAVVNYYFIHNFHASSSALHAEQEVAKLSEFDLTSYAPQQLQIFATTSSCCKITKTKKVQNILS